MTDETETDDEVEWEVEEDDAGFPYPDTLGIGQAFFYPDLGVFCEEHNAKAVFVAEDGGIWLFPRDGGKAVSLEQHGKPRGLSVVKPADGMH